MQTAYLIVSQSEYVVISRNGFFVDLYQIEFSMNSSAIMAQITMHNV